jgi:hypothetical protein
MKKKKVGRPKKIPVIATGSDEVKLDSRSKYLGTQHLLTKIAAELERTYNVLEENIDNESGQNLQTRIEKEIALAVARIKHKALKQFEVMLDSPMPPAVRLGYLRFAIGEDLAKGTGPQPEQLVFETMISETGTVEQTQRKVFTTRTTVTKGDSHDRPDSGEPLF